MRFSDFASSVAFASLAHASGPHPISIPSSKWLGVDGNWSTVAFSLGSTSQDVNVFVSTILSEFWAVGSGGCLAKEPHCSTARGGLYTPTDSKDWSPLGIWQLGLNYLGYGGNGEYGTDTIWTYDPRTETTMTMESTLMAAINTTNYLNGLFGLGIAKGTFGEEVMDSPLIQAVQTFGWIPSYSYGYTAGAHYRNYPVSLVLGGYDSMRLVDHSNEFTLPQGVNVPLPLVRGITLTSDDQEDAFDDWNSTSEELSTWDTSFEAVIDSTTPYLWLPEDVCDKFVDALNLTYNSTFDLYTLTNEQYREYSRDDSFSFTFTLSSFDNTDNFGEPLRVPGVVNITIPSKAFVGLLQYPFMGQTIGYGEPAVPYFTLRRASNNATFILGRAFLQESYLITKYDEGLFSIHQALFPDDAASWSELTPIMQPVNSPYPGPASRPDKKSGLSAGQIAGIAVGAVLACIIALVGWFCYRRRQKSRKAILADEGRDSSSLDSQGSPRSIFSRLVRRKKAQKSGVTVEVLEKSGQELSEAPNTQIYEMPAPVPPAELAGDDANSLDGDTELGTDSTQGLSAYEIARRKMERQLQGPVPAYSPPSDGSILPPEKSDVNINASAPRVETHPSSPTSPKSLGSTGNSLPPPLPSPMTPGLAWTGRPVEPPSPMTSSNPDSSTRNTNDSLRPVSPLPPSSDGQTYGSTNVSQPSTNSTQSRGPSNNTLPVPPVPTIQRTLIDPSRVVFLGPLPENVRLSRRNSGPQPPDSDAASGSVDESSGKGHRTYDSLGSNFTVEEERRLELETQLNTSSTQLPNSQGHAQRGGQQQNSPTDSASPLTPQSQERIDPGTELVHVPQMAARRYSWEDDR